MADITELLLTGLILLALFILAYCKITNKTLIDVWREIKEMFTENKMEVRK